MKLLFIVSLLFLLWLSMIACLGQLKIPEASPAGFVIQKVGFTTIRVYYERPAARSRTEKEIFGGLVPWREVWRTGAGNCTKIAFSTDVFINGKTIPRGTYSLFTIPDKKNWTVILNTDTVSYGTYSYDEKKDVMRFKVKPHRSNRYYESLTIDIDVIPNDARIYLSWLNTQIDFDVSTGVDRAIMSFINTNLILKDSNDPELYENAIGYYLWHNKDRKQVMIFIEKGIQLKNHRIWYYWKVRELVRDRRYNEALDAANTAIDAIRNSPEEEGYAKAALIKDFEDWIAEIKLKLK
jgi:hypothetical protein